VLQLLYKVKDIKLYPLLSSRNKKVVDAIERLKKESISNGWEIASPDCFYQEYLEILKATAEETNSNVATIEMLLFATTEDLIRQWESKA
jgi:flagellar biosynthesis/type III secretory pathway chaperone